MKQMKRWPTISSLIVGIGLFPLIAGVAHTQALQGFDPNAVPVAEFKLTPFYEVTPDFADKHTGDILKTESIQAPVGALAWRVMYVSRTWDDRLVPVTGIIVVPKAASATPRPILNWAHGTTGGARVCAPSLADNPAQDFVQRSASASIDYGVPYLTDFLARGYVVVASDFYGLGGPGVHQYMVGESGSRNMLDLARAARNMKSINAGTNLLSLGWSQGGHAALFAGESQPAYAPEFRHLGIAALAPGSIPPRFMNIPHAYVLVRAYHDAYYASLDDYSEQAKMLIAAADKRCIVGIFHESVKLKDATYHGDFATDPIMSKAIELNRAGKRKSAAPVFVAHGTIDSLMPPESTRMLLKQTCKVGSTIKVSWQAEKNHRTAIESARPEILGWFDDRLNGKPAPSDCLAN